MNLPLRRGAPLRLIAALGIPVILVAAAWLWTTQPVWPRATVNSLADIDPGRLRQDVANLAGPLAKRDYAHPAVLARAAGYIGGRFREAGARVEMDTFPVDGADYSNIIARFGPSEGRPIVIGAHYDVEESTPGADDNASGVAGLLALADHFRRSPPKVPVELVAYSLEEPPHFSSETMGSRRHARALKAAGREPRLVMAVEMIGFFKDEPGSQAFPVPGMDLIYPDRGNFIGVVGNYASVREVRLVKAGMLEAGTIPVEAIAAPEAMPGVGFSDHASYWREGLPAVMVTDTAFYRNPNYHRSTDLPDTLDYRRMAAVVQALAQVVTHLEEQEKS